MMIRRVISTSTIGTALEWYDFSLYGTASALVFGKLFFPDGSEALGTLASFATFAVGFFFRPVGGVVIGHFGDRVGRRPMMVLTLVLMGVASTGIGLLPTYGTIGVAAPILLVLLRVVQGIGSGAEFAGASLMTSEYSAMGRRGFYGSFPAIGNGLGIILATAVFALVGLLPDDQFLAWGWRLPFLLSFAIVAIGLYIRLRVSETPAFQPLKRDDAVSRVPLVEVLRKQPRVVVLTFLANLGPNIAGYVPAVFVLTYVSQHVGLSKNVALTGVLVATSVRLVTPALFGALADRVGRRAVYVGGAVFSAVVSFPFFWMLDSGEVFLVWLAITLLLGVGDGAMLGPQAAFYAELFDTRVRYSGIALSREMSAALIGGTGPLVAAALVGWSGGSGWPVAAYMAALFAIAAVAARLLPETLRSQSPDTSELHAGGLGSNVNVETGER